INDYMDPLEIFYDTIVKKRKQETIILKLLTFVKVAAPYVQVMFCSEKSRHKTLSKKRKNLQNRLICLSYLDPPLLYHQLICFHYWQENVELNLSSLTRNRLNMINLRI